MECGVDFCFRKEKNDNTSVVSNTFDAHRLMHFVKLKYPQLADATMDALFSTYQEKVYFFKFFILFFKTKTQTKTQTKILTQKKLNK